MSAVNIKKEPQERSESEAEWTLSSTALKLDILALKKEIEAEPQYDVDIKPPINSAPQTTESEAKPTVNKDPKKTCPITAQNARRKKNDQRQNYPGDYTYDNYHYYPPTNYSVPQKRRFRNLKKDNRGIKQAVALGWDKEIQTPSNPQVNQNVNIPFSNVLPRPLSNLPSLQQPEPPPVAASNCPTKSQSLPSNWPTIDLVNVQTRGPRKPRPEASSKANVKPQCATRPEYTQARTHTNQNIPPTIQIDDDDQPKKPKRVTHVLEIKYVPISWRHREAAELLKDCDSTKILRFHLEYAKRSSKRVRVYCKRQATCLQIKRHLSEKQVDGKKLKMKLFQLIYDESESSSDADSDTDCIEPEAKRRRINPGTWTPDVDVFKKDPTGMYGLRPEFLRSLNIVPPIDQWVDVSNFTTGRPALKEVMELAGDVLVCNVMIMRVNNQKYKRAKVMYRHPLEAVQAVSMLNGQMFHSLKLNVSMIANPSATTMLPSGMTCLGPGLGAQGKPLRDVVRHYKNYLTGHSSLVDLNAFQTLPFENPIATTQKEDTGAESRV